MDKIEEMWTKTIIPKLTELCESVFYDVILQTGGYPTDDDDDITTNLKDISFLKLNIIAKQCVKISIANTFDPLFKAAELSFSSKVDIEKMEAFITAGKDVSKTTYAVVPKFKFAHYDECNYTLDELSRIAKRIESHPALRTQ